MNCKRVTVVEKLPGVVRVRSRHGSPRQQPGGVLQRKPRTLDVRRMVRFQQKRPRTHRFNPLIRKRRRLQEATRALDFSERRGDCIRD